MGIEPIFKHFGGGGAQNSKSQASNADKAMHQITRPIVIPSRFPGRRVLGSKLADFFS
jgi:hypothetical protein